MEKGKWKRDETPYLIFQCSKCQQYSYVKTTQKTKKCLRCNYTHKVYNLLGHGEIQKGMTNAVNRVKELQNELARKDLGKNPELISGNGFSLPQNEEFTQASGKYYFHKQVIERQEDYYPIFLAMLRELKVHYKKFPRYLIDIMAESKGIPRSELSRLIRKAFREKFLDQECDLFSIKQ